MIAQGGTRGIFSKHMVRNRGISNPGSTRQDEPVPTECSDGNPAREVVQDGKTSFWACVAARQIFQKAAPDDKLG